jgi:hypothetical protein
MSSTDVGEVAQRIVEQAQQRASEVAEEVKVAAEDAGARFEKAIRSQVDARPLATVAMALGVGWVIGRVLRG